MSDNFQVNKQFARFKGKDVLIGLKNWEEVEGKIITIDNFLNLNKSISLFLFSLSIFSIFIPYSLFKFNFRFSTSVLIVTNDYFF